MSTATLGWGLAVLGVALCAHVAYRSRGLAPSLYLMLVLVFWAIIPNLYFIYGRGRSYWYIDVRRAFVIEFLALVGVYFGFLLSNRGRTYSSGEQSVGRARPMESLNVALLAACVALIPACALALRSFGLAKSVYLARSPHHYPIMLFSLLVLSCVLLVRPQRLRLYWLTFGLFTLYCVLARERDFTLLGAVVLLASVWAGRIKMSGPKVLGFIVLTLVLSMGLGAARSQQSITNELVQGPIAYVDRAAAHETARDLLVSGNSYLRSVERVIGATDAPTPARALSNLISPGASTGYGFSYSAEAYLNFGLVGVVVMSALLAASVEALRRRWYRSRSAAFMSVYLTVVALQALRNDSAVLIGNLVYGMTFLVLLQLAERVLDAEKVRVSTHSFRRATGLEQPDPVTEIRTVRP